jgi:hypothetical protein
VTELAVREEQGVFARVERTETSLSVPDDYAYEEFEELIAVLGRAENGIIWWSADALLQCEHLYHDKVAQVAELLGRSPQTIINRTSAARRVPPSRRNPNVSFTAHAEVAALEPADQKRWLKEAEQECLSTHELRARIQAERDGHPDILEPQAEEMALSVYEAARNVWHSSTRIVGDAFLTPAEVMLEMRKALGE